MDDLEKKLESVPVPEVQVPEFQAGLRKRLLDSYDAVRSEIRMRRLFAVSSVAAAVLLAVSVVFVARPSVPTALHVGLGGRLTGVKSYYVKRPEDREDPRRGAKKPEADDKDPAARSLEMERVLVEKWLKETWKDMPSPSVRSGEMFTVSKHKLSNDKEVFLLTSFPPKKGRKPKVVY